MLNIAVLSKMGKLTNMADTPNGIGAYVTTAEAGDISIINVATDPFIGSPITVSSAPFRGNFCYQLGMRNTYIVTAFGRWKASLKNGASFPHDQCNMLRRIIFQVITLAAFSMANWHSGSGGFINLEKKIS